MTFAAQQGLAAARNVAGQAGRFVQSTGLNARNTAQQASSNLNKTLTSAGAILGRLDNLTAAIVKSPVNLATAAAGAILAIVGVVALATVPVTATGKAVLNNEYVQRGLEARTGVPTRIISMAASGKGKGKAKK